MTDTAQPAAEPGSDDTGSQYVTASELDAKVDPLSEKIDQILGLVTSRADRGDPAPGPSVAEQVRAGVQQLRDDDKAAAEQQAATTSATAWRDSVETRLARAEQPPREPVGRVRSIVQRYGLGIKDSQR
jgi:hypothetical protein